MKVFKALVRDNSLDRKSNRISEYNYSQDGFYFVTVCTQNRVNYFGEISDEKMILNECGKVIKDRWLWLQEQYSYIKLDYFVVMPNHFHGILIIDRSLNVGEDRDLPISNKAGTCHDMSLQPKIKSLSQLVGAFKTTASKQIHFLGVENFQWQRSFYDHVIRDERSLQNIREYIINNPAKWQLDKYFNDV